MTIFMMAFRERGLCDRIDVVFDKYTINSVKNIERSLRGEETGMQLQSITASQIVRQWRCFLAGVSNKTSLIAFLVEEWRKQEYRDKLEGNSSMQT